MLTHVDPSVETVGRLVPTRLPWTDFEPLGLTAVAVFDRKGIARRTTLTR
jgi:hypothetical protein